MSLNGKTLTELEAQWEHNPYAREYSDTSGFLGLKPGRYQLKGNKLASDLCDLVQSDLYSQFFLIGPKDEPKGGSEPSFSLGKAKVVSNQRRSASRLRALLATESADIKSMITASRTIPSQPLEKTRAKRDILEKRNSTQEPTPTKLVVPPREEDPRYKKDQPEPGPTVSIPKRDPTSKERKRPRNKDRRREQSGTPKAMAPNEPNPRNLETLTMGEEPLQLSNLAGNKRPELPTHIDSSLEEPGTETGAACFGPQTLLFVQNPMNQATYDSGKALTRPIERIDQGCLVLAEKQDTKGKSIFFLARVMCVMIFEIPQEGDPEANRALQAKILSKSPGLILTKHHHVRKYGFIHEQEPGGGQF